MRFVCFTILLLQSFLLFSLQTPDVDKIINNKSDLNQYVLACSDDENKVPINYTSALEKYMQGKFLNVNNRSYYGEQKDGIWFALPVKTDADWGRCFFVFDFHYIEHIEFYQLKNQQLISTQFSGTHIPSSKEPLEFINPAFPVEIDKGDYLFLFNVESEETFIPVMLMDERHFVSYSTRRMASLSLLYGVLICFVMVNIYFCLFNKETKRIAVYFILFMLFELLYQASRDGFLNTLLWPDNFFMIDRFYLSMLAISSFMSIPLMDSFLRLEKHNRLVQKIVWIIALTSLVYAPLFFLIPRQYLHLVIYIGRYHEIVLILLQLVLPALFFRKVDTAGKVFSIGWMTAMLFYDIATLKAKGVFPYENFTIMILCGSLTVSISNLIALGIMVKTTAEKKEKAENKLKAAGFQLMQNRSRPHFLMNTFNLLSGLINSKSDKAGKVVELMTRDFNYYTNNAMKPLVMLDEEMGFIENYLKILNIRFDDRLDYIIDNRNQNSGIMIPPFSLQPLVENAVKHASLNKEGKRSVKIDMNGDNNSFCFKVENPVDGEKNTEKGRTHNNILSRLEYYFTEVKLSLSVEDERYFAVLAVEEGCC